jgi:hypothetical protein
VYPEEPKEPYRRPTARVGRNEPCPCGSGLKFKRCCLRVEEPKEMPPQLTQGPQQQVLSPEEELLNWACSIYGR